MKLSKKVSFAFAVLLMTTGPVFGATEKCLSAVRYLGINGNYGFPLLPANPAQLNNSESELFATISSPKFKRNFYGGGEPSFYSTKEGLTEIQEITSKLFSNPKYAAARFVPIGRSLSVLQAFFNGFKSQTTKPTPDVTDLPFSYPSMSDPTSQQRTLLRSHLQKNGLDPASILESSQNIVFMDFLHSGTGALRLLQEIQLWAIELHIVNEVKAKLVFLSFTSSRFMAENHLKSLERESAKESSRMPRPISEEEISRASKQWTHPKAWEFEALVSEFIPIDVSTNYYIYRLHSEPQMQQSFPPSEWGSAIQPSIQLFDETASNATSEFRWMYIQGQKFAQTFE